MARERHLDDARHAVLLLCLNAHAVAFFARGFFARDVGRRFARRVPRQEHVDRLVPHFVLQRKTHDRDIAEIPQKPKRATR